MVPGLSATRETAFVTQRRQNNGREHYAGGGQQRRADEP